MEDAPIPPRRFSKAAWYPRRCHLSASPGDYRGRLDARRQLGSVNALTQVEWERGRARLLEFANILLTWKKQAKTEKPGGFCRGPPTAAGQLDQLSALVDEGKLKPVIAEVFPLARAREAFEHGGKAHAPGKIVLQASAA